tara:strand:- start:124 stop:1071 length:948 start_codon:yes stop_codon:yes gene_type:complete
MKNIIPLLLSFLAPISLISASNVEQMLHWGIEVEDSKFRDPSYYYILVVEPEMMPNLVSLIFENGSETKTTRALVALANILGGDNTLLPFDQVTRIVDHIESQAAVTPSKLSLAYQIVAFYGTKESLEYLKARTTKEFWTEQGMPTFESYAPDAPERSSKVKTAQTIAISAVGQHPSNEVEKYLRSFLKNAIYTEDELLANWINNSLKRRYEYHLTAFERRQEAQKIKDARNQSSSRITEPTEPPASHSVPKAEETTRDPNVPEPETEQPAEVKTPDTSKEKPEQSSQWWLWLVGILVVFGGGALSFRPKNKRLE